MGTNELVVLTDRWIYRVDMVNFDQQVELYNATTMKKEAVPGLRICDFLRSEVC